MSIISAEDLAYLRESSRELIEGGVLLSADGATRLFTPDGHGNYRALWTRDFAYMVRYAGDVMQADEVRRAIEFLVAGQSEAGVVPDRVNPDGRPVYVAGGDTSPLGRYNPDNAHFLVLVVSDHLSRQKPDEAAALFRRWAPGLDRGMTKTPLTARGLFGNNPLDPHSPYGFTDTIGKTGELLMESLLFWEASNALADMHERWGSAEGALSHRERADRIERNIGILWSEADGMFLAATADCRQIDIWGNAYALYAGFPLGAKAGPILDFLTSRYDDYVWCGQIRHLPKGEYWQRLLTDVQPERYMNGAYWATPSGWVLWCLAQRDESLARKHLRDLLDDFRGNGICECINTGYRKVPEYVVSATNVYGAAKRLVAERTRA